MTDPFGPTDPRCICHRHVVLAIEAALAGSDPPLCQVHQADELNQREHEAEVARLEENRDRLAQAHAELRDELSTPDELAARRQAKELDQMDPMARSLHLATQRGSNRLALNARLSSYPSLAGFYDGDDAA